MSAGRNELGRTGAQKRRPLWMQIGFGCGAALLVVVGTLAGAGYVIHRKGTAVLNRAWKELRTTTERLKTAESTKALYRGNPALSEIYPTEKDFLKVTEAWRPKLGDVPEAQPSLRRLFVDPQLLQIHRNRSDGHETVRVRFTFGSGAILVMETDQGKLTNLMLQ